MRRWAAAPMTRRTPTWPSDDAPRRCRPGRTGNPTRAAIWWVWLIDWFISSLGTRKRIAVIDCLIGFFFRPWGQDELLFLLFCEQVRSLFDWSIAINPLLGTRLELLLFVAIWWVRVYVPPNWLIEWVIPEWESAGTGTRNYYSTGSRISNFFKLIYFMSFFIFSAFIFQISVFRF